MSQKRKRIDTSADSKDPIYAGEVEWLRSLTYKSNPSEDVSSTDFNGTRLILEACKLTYVLYHDIEAHNCLGLLIKSLNKGTKRDSDSDVMRQARLKQSSWKSHILNKFFLPHVRELKRKWEVAHPYAGFASLSDKEHTRTWMDSYDSNPKIIISQMLKPIVMVLDLDKIFGVGLMTEDAKRMCAVRKMLRQKYCFGCYCTYKYSVAANNKVRTLEEWTKYTEFGPIVPSILSVADIPVSEIFATMDFSPKKTKKSAASRTFPPRQLEGVPDTTPNKPPTYSTRSFVALGGHKDPSEGCQLTPAVNESPIGEKVWIEETTNCLTPSVSSEADPLSVQTSKVDDDLL